jgi:hypothetical protein
MRKGLSRRKPPAGDLRSEDATSIVSNCHRPARRFPGETSAALPRFGGLIHINTRLVSQS